MHSQLEDLDPLPVPQLLARASAIAGKCSLIRAVFGCLVWISRYPYAVLASEQYAAVRFPGLECFWSTAFVDSQFRHKLVAL